MSPRIAAEAREAALALAEEQKQSQQAEKAGRKAAAASTDLLSVFPVDR